MTKLQSPRISLLDKCQLIVSIFLSFTQVINCEKEKKKDIKKGTQALFCQLLNHTPGFCESSRVFVLKSSSSDTMLHHHWEAWLSFIL